MAGQWADALHGHLVLVHKNLERMPYVKVRQLGRVVQALVDSRAEGRRS